MQVARAPSASGLASIRGISDHMYSRTSPLQPVEVKAFANLILDWADEEKIEISPMKLQKILFFCNADFVVANGYPVIQQEFEAWDYGPVVPSIYAEFKSFRDKPIRKRAEIFDPLTASNRRPVLKMDDDTKAYLRDRFDFYKKFSAIALSDLSHSRAGPWRQARSLFANGLNSNRLISTAMIREYHRLFDT